LTNYLNEDELKLTIPQKSINPLTYTLHPGRSLLFGGFGKIDYVEEEGEKPIQLTIASRIPIHITSIDRSFKYFKEMSEQGKQTILKPPMMGTSSDRIKSWPKLVKCINKFGVRRSSNDTTGVIFKDIVFSGVGWASVEFQSRQQQQQHLQYHDSGFVEEENSVKLNVWAIDKDGVYVRDKSIFPFKKFKKTIVKYTGNSKIEWEGNHGVEGKKDDENMG